MPNRLANESSPYLRQHQNNPVDWFPWGEEAFAKAEAEDKPIFLSVGYSSCHWCHVMEHESFEDDEVAALLNRNFVSVKVDREERPDVDEAYMLAVQLSSGRGGWPMSVFMTPDRKPVFAGTYFPKEDRGQYPGFLTILRELDKVWRNDRAKTLETAEQFVQAMTQSIGQELEGDAAVGPDLYDACVRALSLDFDEEFGGFGQAPKFPPHTAIEFLLNFALIEEAPEELRQVASDMALASLHRMALGGIHDHVGGGFHRYSTDERWLVPHFEKMLYDNALLLGNYARAASLCHEEMPEMEELFSRTADGIVRWLKSEMTSPEGLFYSALDADSEGEEGKYYTWSEKEIRESLGTDADAFCEAFQIHSGGNFRDEATGEPTGTNIPHLLESFGDRFEGALGILRERRANRIRPGLDDKAIVGWNGLMIGALAEAGELKMAERAAEALLKFEEGFGSLPRQIAGATAKGRGFLEDYAYLADGLMALAHAKSLFEETFPERSEGRPSTEWFEEGERLGLAMIERFYDRQRGGFFATDSEHEALFGRSKPVFDQPMPSANGIAIRVLIEMGEDDLARQSLENCKGWMARAPQATEALHLAAMGLGPGSTEGEVAVYLLDGKVAALENGVAEGVLIVEVPDGYHSNGLELDSDLAIETSFPPAPGGRYEGKVSVPFEVRAERGSQAALTVKFQVCTESECRPIEKRVLEFVMP
jgi:uncharacterized protein YyaL (SSP411 family)